MPLLTVMVEEMAWLPVEEQVAPVMPPLVEPPDEELELDEDEELLLDDEELDDEDEDEELLELDDEVEPAYEHHAELTPE